MSSFKSYKSSDPRYIFGLNKNGYCLTLDIPFYKEKKFNTVIHKMNEITIKHHGQVYLGKTPCLDNLEFKACPSKSIDYAVMEKTNNSVVVPLNSAWSDIGSWDSLWELKDKDKDGNVSEGDVILKDVKNTYTSSSNRLVSAIGVNNLIIIDTQDSLLVANKEYSQKINMIVNIKNFQYNIKVVLKIKEIHIFLI